MRANLVFALVLIGALCADGNLPLCAALIGAAGAVTFWPTRSKKKTHLPPVHKKGRQGAANTPTARAERKTKQKQPFHPYFTGLREENQV